MAKLFNNIVFKIITGIIKVVFTILIVAYLGMILIQRITGNQSVMGYRLFTVATGSMVGVYEINDVIAVKDWDVDKLKVGDDIAYQGTRGGLQGMLITHRIIRIEEKEDGSGRIFVTKGVNSPAEDPSIEEGQVLGKVVGVVPVITTVNHIVKSQAGFFLLIFCPLVIIIVLEVLQTITDIQLEKHEIQEIQKEEKKLKKEEKTKVEKFVMEDPSEDNKNDEEIL